MKRFTIIATIACLMTMSAYAQTADLDSLRNEIERLRNVMRSQSVVIEQNENTNVNNFAEEMDRAIYECSAELASIRFRDNDTLYFKGALSSSLPMPEKNLQVIINQYTGEFTFRFVNYTDYKFVAYTNNEFEIMEPDSLYEWVEVSRKPIYKEQTELVFRTGYEPIVTGGKTYYAYSERIPQWITRKVHIGDNVKYKKVYRTNDELLSLSSEKGYQFNEFQFRLWNNGSKWRPSETIKLDGIGEEVVMTEKELYKNLYNLSELIMTKLQK